MTHYQDIEVVDDGVNHQGICRGHVQRGEQDDIIGQEAQCNGMMLACELTLTETTTVKLH